MVTKLIIISLLVLAMITTRAETEELRSDANLHQKIRSIRKFERDTNQSFGYRRHTVWLPDNNFYYQNVPPHTTEL